MVAAFLLLPTRSGMEEQLLEGEEKHGFGCLNCGRPSYIPSPLSSPAAARRLRDRLGSRLGSSPVLARVRSAKMFFGQEQQQRQWRQQRQQQRRGDLTFMAGDAGRIANRHDDKKWDAW